MSNVYLSKPGLICAAGSSPESFWNSAVNGNQSGIKKTVTHFGKKEFYKGQVDCTLLKKTDARYDMHIIRMEDFVLNQISVAVKKAVELFGKERVGVCAGTCDNGSECSVNGHEVFFKDGAFDSSYELEMQSAHYPATFIKEKFNLEDPCLAFATACSSSATAIIKAAQLIKSGICDAVIAGGVDVASDTVLLGFDSLEAVSHELTNPFSKNRSGITMGEAAAFFVLSKEPLDEEKILLKGYGESSDAYHMTSPDPSGKGAAKAMSLALENAALSPEQIDYVNLHGTGTKHNDSMEAAAVDKVFGSYKVPCSTTKPLTGHTLGAAAALELSLCYEAIVQNKKNKARELPVQVWDGERDEASAELNFCDKKNPRGICCARGACSLDVADAPGEIHFCMSNSFAFGGSNACLIIGDA